MNCKILSATILCGVAASVMLGYASIVSADSTAYDQLAAYIQEKGISKDIRPNEYYDPNKEVDYFELVKSDRYRKIQFPSHCVMEIVIENHEEVAPPKKSGLENTYGLNDLEVLTVNLSRVVPSKIYTSKSGKDGTVVILKARKGGIISKEERYFNFADNKSIYGQSMQLAVELSIDSPFGKFECAKQTCSRSRALNGYGITPSKKEHTEGLRDALIDIVKICGGTG